MQYTRYVIYRYNAHPRLRMQVMPLPHDRDTIPYVAFRAIKAKGSEERNAHFRQLRGRALENMSTFTVSRLIFNAKLPSVDVFCLVQRLRSIGLYAGNLWKATRGVSKREREREREWGGESDSSGTNRVREGCGMGGGCRGRGGERLLANVVRYWGRRVPGVMNACQRWDMMRGLPPNSDIGISPFQPFPSPSLCIEPTPEAVVRSSINTMWKLVEGGRNLAISFTNFYRLLHNTSWLLMLLLFKPCSYLSYLNLIKIFFVSYMFLNF